MRCRPLRRVALAVFSLIAGAVLVTGCDMSNGGCEADGTGFDTPCDNGGGGGGSWPGGPGGGTTPTPTPTPFPSSGSATMMFAGSSLTMNEVAARCDIDMCWVNWVGVVTTAGGASGVDVVANSLTLQVDPAAWQDGTIAENVSAYGAAFALFEYRRDFGSFAAPSQFGPGRYFDDYGSSFGAVLWSDSGSSLVLSNIGSTALGATYALGTTGGGGSWAQYVGLDLPLSPSPTTSLIGASASGQL